MADLTTYSKNILLNWLMTLDPAPALARPIVWYVALHTDDPGILGASSEVAIGTDANYVRKPIVFGPATIGQCLSTTQVSWTVNAASVGYSVTHASIKTALTAGDTLFKGPLAVPKVLIANDVLTYEIGEIIAALA